MAKKTIAIIDDEQDVLQALESFFKHSGFDVITAAEGISALDKIRRHMPDIILLDIMLPKLDGYKICRMLKFDDKYKNIPVVILTGSIEPDNKEKAQEVKADLYMTKPFQPEALLEKIKELLALGR